MCRSVLCEWDSLQSTIANCLQNASSLLDLAFYFSLIPDSPLNFSLLFLALLCHIHISIHLDNLTQLSIFGLFCPLSVPYAINLRILKAFYFKFLLLPQSEALLLLPFQVFSLHLLESSSVPIRALEFISDPLHQSILFLSKLVGLVRRPIKEFSDKIFLSFASLIFFNGPFLFLF